MKISFIALLYFSFLTIDCNSQTIANNNPNEKYRIMFYNVENYFDALHDSLSTYNEFTPDGDLHWTHYKYVEKRNNIYKVIKAIGQWKPVAIVGLAEIENEFVISDLINNTPLAKDGYDYVHYDSDDFRGIDVGLIYHKASFTLLYSAKVVISDPKNPDFTTRDLLYVKGLLDADTLHVVVNHWTSRYRGYLESELLRVLASKKLLELTDSICAGNDKANIVLMGDFNDNPENKSMQLITNSSVCGFNNMELISSNPGVLGTLKYNGNWSNFDQILVTNSILNGTNGLQSTTARIFDADFLLESDIKHFGVKTFRTNIGFKYHGGFSDHLPVYFDIKD
ncbi:MAG: endonuclease [Bacteroidetes bacterium]|nr:endonuclease [Bacteroidota bacterium]MBL6943064.1 endonuclease [Bacteroidales bacterium]